LIPHRMVLVASVPPESSDGWVSMAQTRMASENESAEGAKVVGGGRREHDDDYLQLSC